MSKLNPLHEHTSSCPVCQEAGKHLEFISARVTAEFTGKASAPIVPCDDCSDDVHGKQFFVEDRIWTQIAKGQDPLVLCILCAEKRLGRRFRVEDFQQDVIINAPWIYAVGRYGQT